MRIQPPMLPGSEQLERALAAIVFQNSVPRHHIPRTARMPAEGAINPSSNQLKPAARGLRHSERASWWGVAWTACRLDHVLPKRDSGSPACCAVHAL
eukprot:2398461-Pyramimonas_sp.AAC.1